MIAHIPVNPPETMLCGRMIQFTIIAMGNIARKMNRYSNAVLTGLGP